MKTITLTLRTDTPPGYKPAGLRRIERERARCLAEFGRGNRLLTSAPTPDGKAIIYLFEVLPIEPKRVKPLGYAPAPPLLGMTACYGGHYRADTPHKPYYTWRCETAEACTCRKRVRNVTGARQGNFTVPHPVSYSTNPADHAAGCKAYSVLAAGGFVK